MEYDYRHPETPEEIKNVKAKLSVATYKQKNLFARFMAGDYEWAEFQADNGCQTLVELGYYISTRPPIESIIAAYSDFGIVAEPVKGGAWHTQSMVAVYHGGIQYGLDDRGRYAAEKDKNSIEHAIKHFKLMSTHYHNRIKTIHNHLVSKSNEPIWVLAGGGYQIQASFGNKNGYIATLDLDINSFVKVGVENLQRAKTISNKKYEISMNANNFNGFFSDFKLNDFIVKVQ
jgi:hypothetical protein